MTKEYRNPNSERNATGPDSQVRMCLARRHGQAVAQIFNLPYLPAGRQVAELYLAERRIGPTLRSLPTSGRVQLGDTSQRGRAATKGARLCPQDQPQRAGTTPSVGVKPEPLAVPTRCGWCFAHSRAPQNRRGPRRFGQILIEYNSALRWVAKQIRWFGFRPFGLLSSFVICHLSFIVRPSSFVIRIS